MKELNIEKVNKSEQLCGLKATNSYYNIIEQAVSPSTPEAACSYYGSFLQESAAQLRISLDQKRLDLFSQFAQLLTEANKTMNLTRIIEPRDIAVSHYLDSLTCLSALTPVRDSKVIDIGSGAGFPGIPIQICRPDLFVTMLDSTGKKVNFIDSAIKALELENANALLGRAEEIGRDKKHRDAYDIAYVRALAGLSALAEMSLPLVKVGGYLIAQKSADFAVELEAARPLIGQLGGKIAKTMLITIPTTDIVRCLIVINKVKATPENFPRHYSKIVASKKK